MVIAGAINCSRRTGHQPQNPKALGLTVPPELLAHANEGSHCDESGTACPHRRGNEAKALVNLLCRYPVGSTSER